MAKQKSFLKIEGTLDELTFYKRGDSYHVKRKGGVSADRVARDPAFARTRENGLEFGSIAKSGKTLRQAFRSLLHRVRDHRIMGRLSKLLHAIKKLDKTSQRGLRNVGVGIEEAGAKDLLKGFDFNSNAKLSTVMSQIPVLEQEMGVVTLTAFDPREHLLAPAGATHFSIRSLWAKIDFVKDLFDQKESNIENRTLDAPAADIVLTPVGIPQGVGTDIFTVLVEFSQEVNGQQYPIQNGSYNALAIIEVL